MPRNLCNSSKLVEVRFGPPMAAPDDIALLDMFFARRPAVDRITSARYLAGPERAPPVQNVTSDDFRRIPIWCRITRDRAAFGKLQAPEQSLHEYGGYFATAPFYDERPGVGASNGHVGSSHLCSHPSVDNLRSTK